MIFKFFFKRMSLENQIKQVRKRGMMLGSRIKDGRKIYIYMMGDLFVEVIYKTDSIENDAESLTILRGLDNLNSHLEREFKTSF